MKRFIRKNYLLLLGIALTLLSWYLLSPKESTSYNALINRAFLGIGCSIAAAICMLLWIWRR